MSPSIKDIEGIGPAYTKKLSAAGIKTTARLLERGKTAKGRKELEDKTGIGHKLILEWVNLADLFRVKGVGEQYSDLLEEAGVDTVKELRNRRADALWQKIKEVNEKKKLVRKLPSVKDVDKWIAHAKKLPPVVEY
jgi:predicted flap endonuclease-1-like 5' DNA nuclease